MYVFAADEMILTEALSTVKNTTCLWMEVLLSRSVLTLSASLKSQLNASCFSAAPAEWILRKNGRFDESKDALR